MLNPKIKPYKTEFPFTCLCGHHVQRKDTAYRVGPRWKCSEACAQKVVDQLKRVTKRKYKPITKDGGKIGTYHTTGGRVIKGTNST